MPPHPLSAGDAPRGDGSHRAIGGRAFDAYAAWEALWRDLGSRRHYVETGMLAITRGAELVVAAGPWAPRLVAGTLGGRVVPSRQVAVYVAPPAAHRQAWRRAPMVLDAIGTEEEQGGFYAVPPAEGEAIKVSDHGLSRRGDPDRDREPTPEDVRTIMDICRDRLRDFGSYRVAEARDCFCSVTADERFIAEKVERAWALAGCSGDGFKFGASIGIATAEAIDGGRAGDDLRTYAAGSVPGRDERVAAPGPEVIT